MDINAAAADGQSKATAWLTQNLPVETPVPAVVPDVPVVKVDPVAPVITKPGISDAIRRDREARTAASTASAEATKYRGELDTLRKENEQLKSLGAANDPFEFLRGRKLTKEQQALWGQAFLYDLKPEVAPQEFRLDLYKAEQARKEAAKAEADERSATETSQQLQREHLDRYANDLFQHVQSSPGSSPESELWFSEDGADGSSTLNHKVYAQSLLATADNLARRAQAQGQQADLSPANVAKVLEAEVSKRMKRRDAKKASSADVQTKQTEPVIPAGGGTQATTTTSADGLRGGAPLPKASTDAERAARAAAVLFGTK